MELHEPCSFNHSSSLNLTKEDSIAELRKIEDIAWQAVALANRIKGQAGLLFDGELVLAKPGDTPKEVIEDYLQRKKNGSRPQSD